MTMRALRCAPIAALLIACGPNTDVQPAAVHWMDWPAEVLVSKPFEVRMILYPPVCFPHRFRAGAAADESAVTFAPYFLVERAEPICPPTILDQLPSIVLDTLVAAPRLAASSPRTSEMRAASLFDSTSAPGGLPVRTFGAVTVRPSDPDTSRRNAGGFVVLRIDDQGCVRVTPMGYDTPDAGLVLEDQADTTRFSFAFVRGYIHEVPVPVCGQTRVFHLLARN